MAYTKADVEADVAALTTGLQSWQPSPSDIIRALAARERLKVAALRSIDMETVLRDLISAWDDAGQMNGQIINLLEDTLIDRARAALKHTEKT